MVLRLLWKRCALVLAGELAIAQLINMINLQKASRPLLIRHLLECLEVETAKTLVPPPRLFSTPRSRHTGCAMLALSMPHWLEQLPFLLLTVQPHPQPAWFSHQDTFLPVLLVFPSSSSLPPSLDWLLVHQIF
jgi:hypothetical protein